MGPAMSLLRQAFTIHNASIKTILENEVEERELEFTIHNASIKTSY